MRFLLAIILNQLFYVFRSLMSQTDHMYVDLRMDRIFSRCMKNFSLLPA